MTATETNPQSETALSKFNALVKRASYIAYLRALILECEGFTGVSSGNYYTFSLLYKRDLEQVLYVIQSDRRAFPTEARTFLAQCRHLESIIFDLCGGYGGHRSLFFTDQNWLKLWSTCPNLSTIIFQEAGTRKINSAEQLDRIMRCLDAADDAALTREEMLEVLKPRA